MSGRSPLKIPPLRNPGQSLDEEIERIRYGNALDYVFFAMSFCMVAFMEWVGYLLNTPRYPIWLTGAAIVSVVIAAFKIRAARAKAADLRLGRDGERFVGQKLEELRALGAHIIHDIPADGFNIDHVVICDRGVFVIETKTYSKRSRDAKVTFVGEELLVEGCRPDRNPIEQARAETKWLVELIRRSTGETVPARGAILFPNWWVDRNPERIRKDVWVLEPKAFVSFLKNEPVRLRPDRVTMIALHLSTYVHSKAQELA